MIVTGPSTGRPQALLIEGFASSDEAFFTGTAAEVLPIQQLDGRVIGSGKRGPITEQLQKLYFDHVMGRTDKHPEWISLV